MRSVATHVLLRTTHVSQAECRCETDKLQMCAAAAKKVFSRPGYCQKSICCSVAPGHSCVCRCQRWKWQCLHTKATSSGAGQKRRGLSTTLPAWPLQILDPSNLDPGRISGSGKKSPFPRFCLKERESAQSKFSHSGDAKPKCTVKEDVPERIYETVSE